jgi:hypothetical protein
MALSEASERSMAPSISPYQLHFDAKDSATNEHLTINNLTYQPIDHTVSMSDAWNRLHIIQAPLADYAHSSPMISQQPLPLTYETGPVQVDDPFTSQVGIFTQANRPWVTEDQSHQALPLYGTLNSNPAIDPHLMHSDTSLQSANPHHHILNSMSPVANSASTY